MSIPVLTLREAIKYNPDTGLFFWRDRPIHHFKNDDRWSAGQAQSRWNTRYSGRRCFCQENKNGYFYGGIDGKKLLAHRVAWAIQTGSHPQQTIDHINGVRGDNRIANLREASRSQQSRNTSSTSGATSSFLGVSFRRDRGYWRAVIFVEGKQKFLGSFESEIEAAKAYDAAAVEYFGQFSRLNFPANREL